MTILILFHNPGYRFLKHFYQNEVCVNLRHLFPQVVSYNRFVELEKEAVIPLTIFGSIPTNESEELFAGLGLVEGTAEVAGRGDAALLLHAAHLHAHVLCLDDDHDAERLKGFLDALAYLLRHALLYLQAVGEAIYHAGYLAQSGHMSVGDVGHVHFAVEGQHVVFAEGIEIDVPHDDHLAIVFAELGRVEYGHGVLFVATCHEGHCPGYSLGCLDETFAPGIFAEQADDGTYVF